jgi:hypothetical protein
MSSRTTMAYSARSLSGSDGRRQHADAVGADEACEVRFCRRQNPFLQRAAFGAAEPGAKDHDRLGAAARELIDQFGHRGGWRRNDGQVGGGRQLRDAGIAGHTRYGLVFRIDERDVALEAAVPQIAEHHFADGAVTIAGADEGDRRRLEEAIEIANRHVPGHPDVREAEWSRLLPAGNLMNGRPRVGQREQRATTSNEGFP